MAKRENTGSTVAPKFMRLKDGADYYGMCLSTFTERVKMANATYKVGKMVLVNREIFDEYLEEYRVYE